MLNDHDDFHKIRGKGGPWAKEETIGFWLYFGSGSGYKNFFEGILPLWHMVR